MKRVEPPDSSNVEGKFAKLVGVLRWAFALTSDLGLVRTRPVRNFLIQLATLGPIGRLRPAPGTWGTLAAMPLAALLGWAGPLWHMGFVILLLPISIVAAEFYEQEHKSHDAKDIVIDEVLGVLIAMTWLPFTWQSFLAGFFLFRFFDILKPFPISVLDRKVKGGMGVVVDDVAAGMITNVLLQFTASKTAWLGIQSIVVQSS